jgi:hypothetical protein
MKQIPLTQGQIALVDDDDYEWLCKWHWCARWSDCTQSYYALSNDRINGKRRTIYMHREILDLSPGDGWQADHRNGNTLDNRRANLRVASHKENGRNRRNQRNNTSGFKGVMWHKSTERWRAQIYVDKQRIHIGTYLSPLDAARAYNEAALKYHGPFARLNDLTVSEAA